MIDLYFLRFDPTQLRRFYWQIMEAGYRQSGHTQKAWDAQCKLIQLGD